MLLTDLRAEQDQPEKVLDQQSEKFSCTLQTKNMAAVERRQPEGFCVLCLRSLRFVC